ncbi:MAG TPA: DUF58 domain-containing protein [Nocardioides sp.]|nr:DUF58 domain-containing protein [Nocardioides sp.]
MARRSPRAAAARHGGRITETGWSLAGLAVTGYVVGERYHWPELLLLGTAAATLVVLGLVVVLVPRRIQADLQLRPSRVTAGEPATALVDLHGGWVSLVPPVVEVRTGAGRSRTRSRTTRGGADGARRSTQAVLDLPTRRRGVFPVGPAIHVRTDPLGLFTREREVSRSALLHVRPVVTRLPSLASGIVHDLEGVASNKLAASDLSFHALREYEAGDDPRHIHWRSTARAGSLLVRQFQLTRRSHATVLLDPSPSAYAGDHEFELAVSAAASLALRALSDDYEVTFGCGDDAVTTREPQIMLDTACRLRPGGATLHEMGVRVASQAGGTSLVVMVSGGRSEPGDLRHAVSHLPSTADSVVVRADAAAEPRVVRSDTHTSVVLSELGQLSALLVRASS